MANWVNLKELFQKKEAVTDPQALFIKYRPDEGEYTFSADKTGAEKERKMLTERELGGWHASVTDDNKVILVADKPTMFEVKLRGSHGWANLEEILNEGIKACYSNAELKATGVIITSSVFEGLSNSLIDREMDKCYLLGTKTEERDYLAVLGVTCGKIKEYKVAFVDGSTDEYNFRIRPAVLLPSNIVVNLGDAENDGSTPDKALEIRIDVEATEKSETTREKQIAEAKLLIKSIWEETERLNAIINNLK